MCIKCLLGKICFDEKYNVNLPRDKDLLLSSLQSLSNKRNINIPFLPMKRFFTLFAVSLLLSAASMSAFSFQERHDNRLKNSELPRLSEVSLELYGELPKAAARVPQIISSPVGESKEYLMSGTRWYMMFGIIPFEEEYDGVTTKIVFADDNKIYIKNPISAYPTDTYIEGVLADGVATFSFPQTLTAENIDGTIYEYRAQRVEYKEVGGLEEGTFVPSEKQTITFSYENGRLVMEQSDGRWMLGLTDETGRWQGYGDYNVVYATNDYEAVVAPDNLKTETWQFISNHTGFDVNIGFDGDDFYIQGLVPFIPEAWVKGKVQGSTILFEGAQYMGISNDYNCLVFFLPGNQYTNDNGRPVYELAEKLELNYDAAKREITTDGCMVINSNPDNIQYLKFYTRPLIHPDVAEHSMVPRNIVPVAYMAYNPEYKAGGYQFYIPNLTVDGYIINKDDLYWELYINSELYVFDPLYYPCFTEPTTEVPFNTDSSNYELYNDGSPLHELHFFFTEPSTFGVIVKHKASDGKVYTSDLVVYYPEGTGVDEISVEDNNLPEVYYDISGRRIENPQAGTLYIVKKGSKVTKKVMR